MLAAGDSYMVGPRLLLLVPTLRATIGRWDHVTLLWHLIREKDRGMFESRDNRRGSGNWGGADSRDMVVGSASNSGVGDPCKPALGHRARKNRNCNWDTKRLKQVRCEPEPRPSVPTTRGD